MNTSGIGYNENQSIKDCTDANNKVFIRHCLHLFLSAINCYDGRWECEGKLKNEDKVIEMLDHLYSNEQEGYDQCLLGDQVDTESSNDDTKEITLAETEDNKAETKIEFKCEGYNCDLPCSYSEVVCKVLINTYYYEECLAYCPSERTIRSLNVSNDKTNMELTLTNESI